MLLLRCGVRRKTDVENVETGEKNKEKSNQEKSKAGKKQSRKKASRKKASRKKQSRREMDVKKNPDFKTCSGEKEKRKEG